MKVCIYNKNNHCYLLRVKKCIPTECTFYKSVEMFESARDEAIKKNRAKGNCANCKYVSARCKLKDEPEIDEEY